MTKYLISTLLSANTMLMLPVTKRTKSKWKRLSNIPITKIRMQVKWLFSERTVYKKRDKNIHVVDQCFLLNL
jgi:hypothetical protein